MRKIFKNIIVFIAGAMVSAVLLELYYQVAEITLPYHELNPKLGKVMIPSRRITYFEEGFYLGRSNEYGYLGHPYPPAKEKGKIRIALLGDSYTEGFFLFEQHHFSQLLERELNKDLASPAYEVLNFGIGNYNYNDIIILYKNYAEKFNSDILIFSFGVRDLEFREGFVPSPVLKIEHDSLMIDYSFTTSKTFKLYNDFSILFENSCLLKSLNNAYKLSKRNDVLGEIIFGKFYLALKKPEPEEIEETEEKKYVVDERIIKSFNWLKDKKVYFMFRGEIPAELQAALKANNISYISAIPILEEKLGSKGINYKYFDVTNSEGHWNHAAQIVIADTLYDMIKKDE
jgi:lysophospholipase L1-like esterase